jgi:hypothetical protein
MTEFIKFVKSIFKWAMIISFGGFLFGMVALMTAAFVNQYIDRKGNKPLEEVFLFALECQNENGFKRSYLFKDDNRSNYINGTEDVLIPFYVYTGIDIIIPNAKKNPKSFIRKSFHLNIEDTSTDSNIYNFYKTKKFEDKVFSLNRTSLEMIYYEKDGTGSLYTCKFINEKQYIKGVKEGLKNREYRI